MSNSQQNKKKARPHSSPSPPRWKGRDSMELAFELNKRTFNLLKETGTQYQEIWSRLDHLAIERAAKLPFVILDVNLTDEGWWRSAPQVLDGSCQGDSSALMWPSQVAQQLMGELLVFAWHTAKWDRRVARLSLGMSPEVSNALARLTPHELDSVSARHSGALRLRWQTDAAFWARLVHASCTGDDHALTEIRLYAKLLLSGGLIGR